MDPYPPHRNFPPLRNMTIWHALWCGQFLNWQSPFATKKERANLILQKHDRANKTNVIEKYDGTKRLQHTKSLVKVFDIITDWKPSILRKIFGIILKVEIIHLTIKSPSPIEHTASQVNQSKNIPFSNIL